MQEWACLRFIRIQAILFRPTMKYPLAILASPPLWTSSQHPDFWWAPSRPQLSFLRTFQCYFSKTRSAHSYPLSNPSSHGRCWARKAQCPADEVRMHVFIFFPNSSVGKKVQVKWLGSSRVDKICYDSCRNGSNEIAVLEPLFNKIHYHQTNTVSLQKFIYASIHLWN